MKSSAAALCPASAEHARPLAALAPGWIAPVLTALIVPTGAAIAAGLTLAHWLTPRWTAGGLMHATGYPKNVEITATLLAVGFGAATALLVRWRWAYGAAVMLAAVGWWRGLLLAGTASATVVLPVSVGFAALAIALDRALAAPPAAPPAAYRGERVLAALALAALCLVVGVQLDALQIDVFHHGEVLLSALDLLHGGRPFVTMSWPHGLHDTGGAALWIALTGKVGSSPVALARATAAALAPLTLYVIVRRVVGTPLASVTATAAAMVLLIVGGAVLKGPQIGLVAVGACLCIALAFAAASARPRPWTVAAGAALLLAHLVRIDAGLYGVPAVGAVLAYRALADAARSPAARLGLLLRWTAGVLIGAGLALAVLHSGLGWPDDAWRAYVFETAPRYHSVANGVPFPWPGAGQLAPPLVVGKGVAAVLLALVLAASALRRLPWGAAARAEAGVRMELLLFLAVLACAVLRSALGRSDTLHLLVWSFLPALGAVVLAGAAALAVLARRPWLHAAALLGLLAVLLARVMTGEGQPIRQLVEHLRPNPAVGACGDTSFTARELAGRGTRAFVDDTCTVEQTLRERALARFLTDHAAPWYYVRFVASLPSPYYALSRAYAPADQWQLIADVRAAGIQALFKVRGYRALDRYDVHNLHRVPIVEAFLRGRRAGAPVLSTPLGRLVLWNEPGTAAPPAPPLAAGATPELAPRVARALYDPATAFLELQGWIRDPTAEPPLAMSLRTADGTLIDTEVDFRPRAAAPRAAAPRAAGWSLVARMPSGAFADRAVTLHLRTADGRWGETALESADIDRLPPRSGAEWSDLLAQVDAAEQLGRADRAAAQR